MGMLTGVMLPGNYDIPNLRFELQGVYTNKTPVGAYRGAGRPEATYLLECLIDAVADELSLDPAEVRRKNFIGQDRFPHTTPFGTSYDSGDYVKALDRRLEFSGYQQLRDEQAEARARGELMGIGLAAYVEICGFGPWEQATVRVDPSGKISAYTGTSPHGQGTADQPGPDRGRRARRRHGRHHRDPRRHRQVAAGNGTGGSRASSRAAARC